MILHRTLRRRTVLLAALTSVCAASVHAQADYPRQPVKLIVPFAASGSADLAARLIAEFAGRELGQPIVVENKAGAGGSIGMEMVAKAKADGYTLGMATVSTHGANPALYGSRLKYHPVKDFAPITNVATTPSVLMVHPRMLAANMQQFIALAKVNPGRFSYATPGVGSLGHANMAHFQALAKIQLMHVPYKGSGVSLNDAVAGHVDIIQDQLPTALPHIKAGSLRPIALLSEQRSPALPDVPTYGELGFPQMGGGGWFGVVAPAGTPPPIIAKLNAAIHKGMKHPDFIKKMAESGATPIPGTPADFSRQIQQAMDRYERVAKAANIRAE
jgi:tripartite-type tricarboxylate transporter receptor subunit TctC